MWVAQCISSLGIELGDSRSLETQSSGRSKGKKIFGKGEHHCVPENIFKK